MDPTESKAKIDQLFSALNQEKSFLARSLLETTIMPQRMEFQKTIRANFQPEQVMDMVKLAVETACLDIADDLIKLVDGEFLMENAFHRNSVDDARLLLDRGVPVDTNDSCEGTFLHRAAKVNLLEIAKLLLDRGAQVDARIADSLETPLIVACTRDNCEMIKLFLDRGADVNAANEDGYNPLHITILWGNDANLDCAKLLIERGVDLEAIGKDGTPLMTAVDEERTEMVKLLIERGADVSARSNRHYFAIHIAAQRSLISCIDLLIKNGADINQESWRGFTPLHIACKYASPQTVKFLLENGADINAKNRTALTPLYQLNARRTNKKLGQICVIVISHLAKLIMDGKPIDRFNIFFFRVNPKLKLLFKECFEELKRLKLEKFYNDVSLYHILSIPIDKLVLLLRNEDVVRAFESSRLVDKLIRIYREEICDKFAEAKLQLDGMRLLEAKVNSIFSCSTSDVKEQILHHLAKDTDLRFCN